MKLCPDCKATKDEAEFYERWQTYKGERRYHSFSHLCKKCWCKRSKKNYEERPSETKRSANIRSKLSRYGLTEQEYNKMFDEQNGCCAICGKHQSEVKKSLYVDHDHKTGKNRKLLCQHCNSLLGFADDNVNALEAAIRYLRG